jgi:hypothetical protein
MRYGGGIKPPTVCAWKAEPMTRFFVNESEIKPPPGLASLDQILKHVEETHLSSDSVVKQIHIDGLPVLPDSSENLSEAFREMANTKTVEIFTGTLAEIARESLSEAIHYVHRVESITPSLANSFQSSPGPDAFENLRQLSEGFYWLHILLENLEKSYGLSLKGVLIRQVPVEDHLNKLVSVLKQLVQSQEKGDFTMISDLLEYEILPLMPVWREIFSFVLKKVEEAG